MAVTVTGVPGACVGGKTLPAGMPLLVNWCPAQLSVEPIRALKSTKRSQEPTAAVTTTSSAGHTAFGGSTSLTVTWKLHGDVFVPSVAENVTVVTPSGNGLPLSGPAVCVTIAPPGQLSVACTTSALQHRRCCGASLTIALGNVGDAVHKPGAVPVPMLLGQPMTGAMLSTTFTLTLHDLRVPDAVTQSVATTGVPMWAQVTLVGDADSVTGLREPV